jgi:hypothetical protein
MLTSLDKFLAGALGLIFVYLLVFNYQGSVAVFNALAAGTGGLFKVLQGR